MALDSTQDKLTQAYIMRWSNAIHWNALLRHTLYPMGLFIGKMTTIREHFHKEEVCYSWTENLKATIHPTLMYSSWIYALNCLFITISMT